MSTTVDRSPEEVEAAAAGTAGAGAGPAGRAGRPGRAGRAGRRPDRWKTAFFLLAAAALVGGVTWALLGSSLFVVRSVQVNDLGNSGIGLPGFPEMPVSQLEVKAATGIKIGTPLVRVDTSLVRRKVAAITAVQSVTVRRSWPDAVVIFVVPRTAVFTVRVKQGFDMVDSYGVVLGQDVHRPAGLLPLQASAGPAALRRSPAVLAAGAVVRHLPSWLRDVVGEVKAERAGRVILVLRGGITVIWGDPTHASAKAKETAILLRTNARYFDVSDPLAAVSGRPR